MRVDVTFSRYTLYVVVFVIWNHYRLQENLCATSNSRKALRIADEEAKKRGLQVYYGESSHDAKDEDHIWIQPLTDRSLGTRLEQLQARNDERNQG